MEQDVQTGPIWDLNDPPIVPPIDTVYMRITLNSPGNALISITKRQPFRTELKITWRINLRIPLPSFKDFHITLRGLCLVVRTHTVSLFVIYSTISETVLLILLGENSIILSQKTFPCWIDIYKQLFLKPTYFSAHRCSRAAARRLPNSDPH